MDIICLLENYLGFTIQSDNNNLEIPEYNRVRYDHPSNNKRAGVCIRCLLESSISVFCRNA